MKINLSVAILGLILLLASSCNDDLNKVGGSIQPDEDGFEVFTDTFKIKASTILVDSIFARTSYSSLGHFYDPLYGELETDYMCQFYVQDEYKFYKEPINGIIDSMAFVMYYDSWIGDSLTPMKASVYQLDNQLKNIRYTNIDPSDYCSKTKLLGATTYTARDMSVSDSLWNAIDATTGAYKYARHLAVKLPRELGQQFYDLSQSGSKEFTNQEAFNEFFPGVYITNTFGSGNVLDISRSGILLYYQARDTVRNTAGDGDLVAFRTYQELFMVTKDVVQLNRVKNTDLDRLLADDDKYTYLKSPAGVVTRLVLPAEEMYRKAGENNINHMKINLKASKQDTQKFALPTPTNLLILPEDSLTNFFESNGTVSSNIYAVSKNYDASKAVYSFDNMSTILKAHFNFIKENPNLSDKEKELRLLVIPVTVSSIGNIENYLKPSGVKLRKDGEHMDVQLIHSKFKF